MIVVVTEIRLGHVVAELAVGQGIAGQAGVHTGLVQGQGIKGGEHADVGEDGGVVLGVAVTVGADVHNERDVEVGTAVHHCFGILRHAAIQVLHSGPTGEVDGVKVAGTDAPATAHAVLGDNVHLPGGLVKGQTLVGALLHARLAAHALVLVYGGLTVVVLLLLTGPGAAAHADVLDGAAKARHLMALEVVQRDEHVSVHNGSADLGVLDVLSVDGDLHVVGALQTVANEDGTAHSHGGEAVFPGAVQVLQGVFPAAHIEGVAVGEEGLATQLLHHISHSFGVVGAEEAQIAQLAEVHLDGHELVIHVDLANACGPDESLELGGKALAQLGAEIGVVNVCFFHTSLLLVSK